MKKYFNDSGLVIEYIQKLLHDNYNGNVKINSTYYTHFDMNYGLAHFIAKYLDYTYPLLDPSSIHDYMNIETGSIRPLKKPISIKNYFLCSNTGLRLTYNPVEGYENVEENKVYTSIYNRFMRVTYKHPSSDSIITVPTIYPNYFITNDPPLLTVYNKQTHKYEIDKNVIFHLESWQKPKQICEIDDLVTSYLIGRVITPKSSREDIYYVQKLMMSNMEIPSSERGIWCPTGAEGTEKDLTQVIINYQRSKVFPNKSDTLFVTGYFDPQTESHILKDLGEMNYGISGL